MACALFGYNFNACFDGSSLNNQGLENHMLSNINIMQSISPTKLYYNGMQHKSEGILITFSISGRSRELNHCIWEWSKLEKTLVIRKFSMYLYLWSTRIPLPLFGVGRHEVIPRHLCDISNIICLSKMTHDLFFVCWNLFSQKVCFLTHAKCMVISCTFIAHSAKNRFYKFS